MQLLSIIFGALLHLEFGTEFFGMLGTILDCVAFCHWIGCLFLSLCGCYQLSFWSNFLYGPVPRNSMNNSGYCQGNYRKETSSQTVGGLNEILMLTEELSINYELAHCPITLIFVQKKFAVHTLKSDQFPLFQK